MKSRSSTNTRALTVADADQALLLYNELTLGPKTEDHHAFRTVLEHHGTFVFGAFDGDALAAMVTLHLLPNVVWNARPYGLIENVVTRQTFQRRGHGRAVMETALEAAWSANAYKVMLMTGQARAAVGFYEALGFSSQDKFAMVIRRN